MKKKHAVARFWLIAVICAVFLCLTVFSFTLPGNMSDYDFVGFARAINLGIEYQGGTVYEYQVKNNSTSNSSSKGISTNATRINYLLSSSDVTYDSNVYQNGDRLIVELFDEYDPISINEIVNTKPYFAIKESNDDDAEVAVDSSQITDAYATTSSGSVVLVMTFTTDGQSAIANLTSSGSGTLYFYFGSEYRGMTYSETINQSYLGITLSGSTLATGEYFASEILSSKYDYSFEETRVVTYSKDDATRNCIVAIALTVALFALCVAILTITFKKLGLVGSLVMFISLLAQIVLLQAVPIFVLTGPSLFASLLCMIVGAIAIYLMLSKMHAEYKLGKILYASVKFGYNKIWLNILDMFLIMLFPSIIAYFFGSYLVKQFAMALICGLCVYAFCSLLFTKLFTKWFTNISFKNKDYGFKREEHINELK